MFLLMMKPLFWRLHDIAVVDQAHKGGVIESRDAKNKSKGEELPKLFDMPRGIVPTTKLFDVSHNTTERTGRSS